MKLIIDIPEELAEKGHWYTDEEMWTVIRAAHNGRPLDKIREEIESIDITMGVKDYPFIPKAKVLEIIDKYKGDKE